MKQRVAIQPHPKTFSTPFLSLLETIAGTDSFLNHGLWRGFSRESHWANGEDEVDGVERRFDLERWDAV